MLGLPPTLRGRFRFVLPAMCVSFHLIFCHARQSLEDSVISKQTPPCHDFRCWEPARALVFLPVITM